MPRDLFGHVTHPSISIGGKKWYTLPLSLVSHSAIVLALIAIPILAPAVMPSVLADNEPYRFIDIVAPTPPPAPKKTDTLKPVENPNAAPTSAPDKIGAETLVDRDPPNPGLPGGVDGIDIKDVELAPPPAPTVVAPPPPVRPGFQGVRTPVKTHHVDPLYPPIAQSARIQGIVIIEATISEDGRVINARVLRSVPTLDQAAIDAVRQWEFTPTMLNGQPVPVIMTVTVNFTLR